LGSAPRQAIPGRRSGGARLGTMDVIDGVYRKRVDPASGKTLPEDNWVWSPQGAIDMHMPERWGVVRFSEAVAWTRPVSIVEDRNDPVKWALKRLYYRRQRTGNTPRTSKRFVPATFGWRE
jgi:hypothetical protein